MHKRPKTLKDVAQAASDNNGGAGGRQLGRIAEKAGLTIAYTTIDKILAGTYTSRPGKKTLEALAQLSGLPLAVVYEAAQMELPQARLADQLPPDVDSLTPEQRKIVIDLARLFVKQNRQYQELESKTTTEDAQDDYRLAAREADQHIGLDQLPEEN
ncbi:hypothetical protein [Pseudarthrobacter sp. LMD1-1-1.1]|uniref:hypothetical protein n=1 Tax=Pseudarthrobacter sp. LMD1-1-1.1 TaxID=3135242 RepID=UPI003441CDED